MLMQHNQDGIGMGPQFQFISSNVPGWDRQIQTSVRAWNLLKPNCVFAKDFAIDEIDVCIANPTICKGSGTKNSMWQLVSLGIGLYLSCSEHHYYMMILTHSQSRTRWYISHLLSDLHSSFPISVRWPPQAFCLRNEHQYGQTLQVTLTDNNNHDYYNYNYNYYYYYC